MSFLALDGSQPVVKCLLADNDRLLLSLGYLYATLANIVITLTALVGIVMLLCTSCTSAFQLVIQFSVSLAVGSLSGDALLHLLPMVSSFTPSPS